MLLPDVDGDGLSEMVAFGAVKCFDRTDKRKRVATMLEKELISKSVFGNG